MSAPAARPRRLLLIALPVCGAGVATFVAGALTFATSGHSTTTIAGVVALLVAMMLADRFPVPVEGLDINGVSLAFVFGVSAVVLFGWAAAVVAVFAAPALSQLLEHRPLLRVAYNASFHGLAAGAAGLLILPLQGDHVGTLLAMVAISAVIQHAVNMLLVTAVVSATTERPFRGLFASNFRATIVPFSLMGSAALMLVVLWQRSPLLSAALVGPLLAIALYQRSTHRELRAMRLALTDPLTGLGNHRHFHERLQRELIDAEERRRPLTLCLIDIDDFKRVNDRFGHPAGDRVLAQVAGRLRQGGEAFRLGGEEFAVLLPGHDAQAGLAVARSVVERVGALDLGAVGSITVSAGVATFPAQGTARDELIRHADGALYWAKEHGKNRVHASRPEVVQLAEFRRLASGPDRAARYRAAASLAKAVDARDAYTGSHSERVGERPRGGRARTARRQPPRPRQVGHPGGAAAQTGAADRRGARRARAAPADRLPDAREPRRRPRGRLGAAPSRALGRRRLPGRDRGRAHPARRPDPVRRGRVRRDDVRSRVPAPAHARPGDRGARELRREPVRPGDRGRVRGGARGARTRARPRLVSLSRVCGPPRPATSRA
jgi:diguanylate cyclase (GGDEF)-like protein